MGSLHRNALLCLTTALCAMTGCNDPAVSIAPLYRHNEGVSVPAILGAWSDSIGAPARLSFTPLDSVSYRFSFTSDSGVVDTTMVARFVRLRGTLMVDLGAYPPYVPSARDTMASMDSLAVQASSARDSLAVRDSTSSDRITLSSADFYTPVHMMARVEMTDSTLTLWMLDGAWVADYVQKHAWMVPAAIGDRGMVLTGTTDQLRDFIGHHLKDKNAFTAIGPLVRYTERVATP